MKLKLLFSAVALSLLSACKNNERSIVVSKIQQAAKLATTETVIDKIVFGTSEKKLLGIIHLNTARFAASSQAIIKTGIDLNKLKPTDIVISANRIELNLPSVEVINFSYPFNRFKIDKSITENKFLNSIDIFDQENFYRLAELDIRNNLKYTGIRQATEQKTRLLLQGLLKNLGYNEIYITFRQDTMIQEIDLNENEVE